MSAMPSGSSPPARFYTPEEYFRFEQKAAYKSEYLNGKISAMPGASSNHVTIGINLAIDIGSVFRQRPCRVYDSDMRVHIEATGLMTYPDLSAVCEEPRFLNDTKPETLLNPALIVEILSESTQRYDRGRKFDHYRQIPTLQEFVLISPERRYVEVYKRESASGDTWLPRIFTENDEFVPLQSIDLSLKMRNIYDKVTLPAPDATSENDAAPEDYAA